MKAITTSFFEIFIFEARNHIRDLNQHLIILEKDPENKCIITKMFTELHTLKSSASMLEYNQITYLCHEMENLLENIRDKKIDIQSCSNILFHCLDHLSKNINMVFKKGELNSNHLIDKIKNLSQFKTNDSTIPDSISMIEKIQSIEVKTEKLDILMNLTEEIIINKMKLESVNLNSNTELVSTIESLSRVMNELQYQVMQIRLVSIDFIFSRFQRMARDLAKKQNKEVNLLLVGDKVELDRSLMDEIAESIAHLIRNAIDHGIESTFERIKLNKPKYGTITIGVKRTRETAIIEVIDDGRGLNHNKIRSKAVTKGIIDNFASTEEISNAIFKGVSTADQVTVISGRGYGLQTVIQKLQSIGGTIDVTSSANNFTRFSMKIPLTLAIINVLFIRVSKQTYAIPIESIYRLHFIKSHQIKTIFNKETILLDEEEIPIIRLAKLLDLHDCRLETAPVVIIQKGKKLLGIMVDSLSTTQSVVIKPLSHTVKDNKYFSGATFLASGEMTLIIDTTFLFQH